MEQDQEGQLIEWSKSLATQSQDSIPIGAGQLGSNARFAWDEFFAIDNDNTKEAYQRAVEKFLAWCQSEQLSLTSVMPGDISRYIKELKNQRTIEPASKETKKLQLSAIRRFFDALVLRHAVVLNPAASVKGPKIAGSVGKTPAIPEEKIPDLFAVIDVDSVVGLRDRVVIGILLFTAARRAAVANLRLGDFWTDGVQYHLRFEEKGGKTRDIPVRHDLHGWIIEYLKAAGIERDPKNSPLIRKAVSRTGTLSREGVNPRNISDLVKRRFKNAGLPNTLKAHSFRATTITNLLSQDGASLEAVQDLAGHADARTTRGYDRSNRKVNRNLVERISF